MKMYWFIQLNGNPDYSIYVNTIEDLNKVLNMNLSKASYESMEIGNVYWINNHRVTVYDSNKESSKQYKYKPLWRN